MRTIFARIATTGAALLLATAAYGAEPLNVVRAPAADEAPLRVEAAMFDMDANLAAASGLAGLLAQVGVGKEDAASAAALAQTQVDDRDVVRVKLGLSRNPDNGAVTLQRMTLSSSASEAVLEQRGGKLRIVSAAPRKLRII